MIWEWCGIRDLSARRQIFEETDYQVGPYFAIRDHHFWIIFERIYATVDFPMHVGASCVEPELNVFKAKGTISIVI